MFRDVRMSRDVQLVRSPCNTSAHAGVQVLLAVGKLGGIIMVWRSEAFSGKTLLTKLTNGATAKCTETCQPWHRTAAE